MPKFFKRTNLGIFFFKLSPLPFFSPSFLLTTATFGKNLKIQNLKNLKTTFLCHDPQLSQQENPLCLSRCKTCWTRIVDNVGMKIVLLETSSSRVNFTFVLDVKMKWSQNKFNDQITYLRDDFTVHDVNDPLLQYADEAIAS